MIQNGMVLLRAHDRGARGFVRVEGARACVNARGLSANTDAHVALRAGACARARTDGAGVLYVELPLAGEESALYVACGEPLRVSLSAPMPGAALTREEAALVCENLCQALTPLHQIVPVPRQHVKSDVPPAPPMPEPHEPDASERNQVDNNNQIIEKTDDNVDEEERNDGEKTVEVECRPTLEHETEQPPSSMPDVPLIPADPMWVPGAVPLGAPDVPFPAALPFVLPDEPLQPDQEDEAPLDAMDAPVFRDPGDMPSLLALAPLMWPPAAQGLRLYFEHLPPCAPFDAPGWRFVRVPMPRGGGLSHCAVGYKARGHVVREIACAVPGDAGGAPPPGLHGYRWQTGRDCAGYWTLWKRV